MALDELAREDDVIYAPSSLSASAPTPVLELCSQINAIQDDVIIDATELAFIDPFGLAMLRATLESQPATKKVSVRWMNEELITYLVRMDFFEGLAVEGIDTQSARNPQGEPDHCVELIRVREGNSEEIASRLIQAMTGMCGEDETAVDEELDADRRPIEYALKELLENALSHAKKEGNGNASVWVACQHFESNDYVRLAIVDNGCGFLATLKGHAQLKEHTHLAAIEAALQERVSCNRGPHVGYETDSQNQGVGLTTTARIAEAAGGLLVVASGDAWVMTSNGLEVVMEGSSWKGVAIAFTCHREKLHLINIPSLLPEAEGVADADISFE
ncbi:ATP-binding protein [Metapseudomonas sp. CR1201]